MFKEREFTPELAASLRKAGVVIASNGLELMEKSQGIDVNHNWLMHAGATLDMLLWKWMGLHTLWSELRGKHVLDIASGSAGKNRARYHPHFARLCAVNGADVTVIDINAQGEVDNQLFTSIQADLVRVVTGPGLQNYPSLVGRSFDLIHSSRFVGANPEPSLDRQLSHRRDMSVEEFGVMLLTQCIPLLAEGGIMSLDMIRDHHLVIYRKVNGEIEETRAYNTHGSNRVRTNLKLRKFDENS